MIKAENRLKQDRQIKYVIAKGFSFNGPLFRAKAVRQRIPGETRLAVLMSKKIATGAVTRNKIKRRVKAAFSGMIGEAKGLDVIVFPTAKCETVEFVSLKAEAEKCLSFLRSRR